MEVSTQLPLIAHWAGDAPLESAGESSLVYDPAKGVAIRQVRLADAGLVDQIVQVAVDSSAAWRALPVARRSALLGRWAALIRDNESLILDLVCEEHGKVMEDARGEFRRGLEVLDVAAGAAPILLKGEFSDQVATGVDVKSFRSPLGVTAAITPFNFPFMIPLWLTSVSMACGNAVVLKPSEQDPSCSLVLAELAIEAGIPAGIFNVVQGGAEAVDALLENPAIAAISFVGSTRVAEHVYQHGTAAGKRVQAFGGAKNHMVVLPDVDVTMAADAAASAAFGSAGQRCMAISALVAAGDGADELVEAIAERAKALRVGPAANPESEMGPLISQAAQSRVLDRIGEADTSGARLVLDGRSFVNDASPDGYFVGPTVVDHVTTDMGLYKEEIFGPVLSVLRSASLDDAISLVNANPYGNGAAIFTSSGSAARKFEREVESGMIGINVPIPIPVAQYSFGGWKASRFGDVHMSGKEAYSFFTKAKIVTSRWAEPSAAGVHLHFGSAGR